MQSHAQSRCRSRPVLAVLLALGAVFTVQAAQDRAPSKAADSKSAASKSAASKSDVQRMTDLQVKMMPFGAIFDMLSKEDPNWPMQEKPDAVTPEQLACLRGELSTPGYRRYKQAQVETYLAENPSRAASEIALLEQGAAELFGKLILAGADSERSGIQANPETLLKDSTPEQMSSFMSFFGDPNHADLRKLSGLGDAISPGKSASENESAGEQLGSTITLQVMLKAMSTCKVPTAALFKE